MPPINAVTNEYEKYEKGKEGRFSEQLEKNPDLKNLSNICDELAASQGLVLIDRDMNTHGLPALYNYYKSKTGYSDLFRSASAFLENKGWHSVENISINRTFAFQKNDIRLTVQHDGLGDADYSITCQMTADSNQANSSHGL